MYVVENGSLMPTLLEIWPGLCCYGHSSIRPFEVVHRHTQASCRRVIDVCQSVLESLENHKMVEVPMYYGRCHTLKVVDVGMPSMRFQPVLSCSQHHIARIATIARDTAVSTQLFKRHPLAVISKQHRQGSRTAFHGFHLHYYRYFLYFLDLHICLFYSAVCIQNLKNIL